jgi:predicted AAA+ superfamily ATPase
MHITRDIKRAVLADLVERMIFIGGPRQVGKTTFAKTELLPKSQYLNWDDSGDRAIIKKGAFDNDFKGLILDEIHKFKNWRSLVKALYDKERFERKIICTGSARLDHFRKGGDSLLGRYRYYRLHPLSILEINSTPSNEDLEQLLEMGGFPQPFTNGTKRNLDRWHKERNELLVRQDLTDLMRVRELSQLELLADLLPSKVGSPLSIKSIHEDLMISPHTVESWLALFEAIYLCYRISPFGPPKVRAVKKQKKLYLFDWSEIKDPGARFENFVASHLLKYCHNQEDINGAKMELRYLRDIDLREIDFVVLKDKKPIFAVECKTGEGQLSRHIEYFKTRTNIPKFYQVHMGTKDTGTASTGRVLPFTKFCNLELGIEN